MLATEFAQFLLKIPLLTPEQVEDVEGRVTKRRQSTPIADHNRSCPSGRAMPKVP
jgi:hypothetical protein